MKNHEIQLFKELDENFKTEIDNHKKLLTFEKGEILFCGDELMHHFYIILSGKVKTFQLNLQNSKEQIIFVLRAGDMFDTIVLLDHKAHDVMYETLEKTKVLELPIEKVREWIATNQDFNQIFFPHLASQMRQVEELATDLSLHNTSYRLVKLLLQNIDSSNKEKYNLIHGLSHGEIAKLIGTVRHVVEKHLHKLKEDGIVETNRHHLAVKSVKELIKKLGT